MVTRIDVHLQSGEVSIYWLWLLLEVSVASIVIVIIAICDMPRQEFSFCERVYIHNTYYVISVMLLFFVQTTQILQFPVINILEIFGAYVLISCQFHLMFRLKNMTSTVHFSILYGACFFEYFSLSPNCTGMRHRSSWKLYSKFAKCFRTRLSAFIYVLSRHVTNRNNHNNYTYSTNV